MEKKDIEINGNMRTIKELKYKTLASLADASKEEASKKLILLSTDMTEEEYEEMSLREGIAIQKAINELNGLDDFQQPLTK